MGGGLSLDEDGPVATGLKFKSREKNPLRGILNSAPPGRESPLPLTGKVAVSCPAPAGLDARIVAMIRPTIKNPLWVTIEDFFIPPILKY